VCANQFLVVTRADLFEKRKQQHSERGYRIEDARPIPVNGFCSFVAVSEIPDSDGSGDFVAQTSVVVFGQRAGIAIQLELNQAK
jgi:hypothetical protein